MYAFYNRQKECYMYMDASIGVVPYTDDTEIDYCFSECGDILYTSKDRTVLERILSLRDYTHDNTQRVLSGSLSKPFDHKILVGYEIVEIGEIIVPEEMYMIRYTEDDGYENITVDKYCNLDDARELMDTKIRSLHGSGLLRDIRVLHEGETIRFGLFDVLKYFLEK